MKRFLAVLMCMVFSLPGMSCGDEADGRLPDGIIAISQEEMKWHEAEAYCREQGGRLPWVNGSGSFEDYEKGTGWTSEEIRNGASLEPYGAMREWPWNFRVPRFWTGTEWTGAFQGNVVWMAENEGILYLIGIAKFLGSAYAVCVPTARP